MGAAGAIEMIVEPVERRSKLAPKPVCDGRVIVDDIKGRSKHAKVQARDGIGLAAYKSVIHDLLSQPVRVRSSCFGNWMRRLRRYALPISRAQISPLESETRKTCQTLLFAMIVRIPRPVRFADPPTKDFASLLLSILMLGAATGGAHANDTLASTEALIACIDEESEVASCAEPFICDPGWAVFHRSACATTAREITEGVLLLMRERLKPVLAAISEDYVNAEDTAHKSWLSYRDANCSVDRSTAFDTIGAQEARDYCYVEHGIDRLAVMRRDLDRFSFKLAAE